MVGSARRLYWLSLGLGALGLVATVLALVTALSAVSLVPPPVAALVALCQRFLLPDLSAGAVVVLALAGLGLAVLFLGACAVLRQLAAHRRFGRELRVGGEVEVAGSRVVLLEDPRPRAFCAGFLRPRIYLSTGARDALSGDELGAVIAHERHHLARRDPLRTSLARTLGEALFFVPILRRVAERYTDLAELAADEAAVRERGAPALASALLSFGGRGPSTVAVGITPERADHLLGERGPRWELPALALIGSLVAVGAVIALGLQLALTADETLNLATLVMQSCMLAMAALPVLVLASAVFYSKALRGVRTRLPQYQ